MGYLISETTKEEREAIVAESLGNIEATCDGCMSGLAEMYQGYIDGKKELREINMEFNARYVHGEDMPGRSGCGYKQFETVWDSYRSLKYQGDTDDFMQGC